MAKTFLFELVSPEKLLFSEQVEEVVLPGACGYLTVLADHAPLMTTIVPGIVHIKTPDKKTYSYVVFGGFADVTGQSCSLLAESAVRKEDVNHDDIAARIAATRQSLEDETSEQHRNSIEEFLHQLTTVAGVLSQV